MGKVIDLFSGVGGLSLGAARAGFEVVSAFDNDKIALETHAKNFSKSKHHLVDISELSGNQLLEMSGVGKNELTGLIGGPPCQGFSTMGKRKKNDKRSKLFFHFFRLVKAAKPKFFLVENVPGILNSKFTALSAVDDVSSQYHVSKPLLLCAKDFGAPTERKRVFILGISKKVLNKNPFLEFSLKNGYTGPTVKEALKGLPKKINPDWQLEDQGWRKVNLTPETDFEKQLVGRIPKGVGNKDSIRQLKHFQRISGCLGTRHSRSVEKRYGNLNPGQQDNVSKSKRLSLNGYCPTLRAGTGTDKGSFQAVRPIHPTEARVITPREAARLQGFPDWFYFHSTKWHSFRQIGNSVSPILAEAILKQLRKYF